LGKYIAKRLLMMIPVLLGVVFLIFFILNLTPSNPGAVILGTDASAEDIAAYNAMLGADKPFLIRYCLYVVNMCKGDLGISYAYLQPVWDVIDDKILPSMFLSFSAMLVATILGVIVGVASAVKQYSALDKGATFFALLLAATPSFWLSMMGIFVFALKLGWFPAFGNETAYHFVLPALTLGIPYAAHTLRYTRSSMLDCIRQDYVDTAKAKGVPKSRVIWKHAFNNAVLPVITSVGTSFGALVGGAMVTEQLYGMAGLGTFLSASIKTRDVPAVCGTVVVIAIIFSLVMLGVDLLHAKIDPRIRARYSKG